MVICLERGANDLHMVQLVQLHMVQRIRGFTTMRSTFYLLTYLLTATPSSLAPVKSRVVYLSDASLPRLSWKKVIKQT